MGIFEHDAIITGARSPVRVPLEATHHARIQKGMPLRSQRLRDSLYVSARARRGSGERNIFIFNELYRVRSYLPDSEPSRATVYGIVQVSLNF